tara:strand:- start:193 stop:555 length:363 start_codon:yes stop_codon:yes gene_type:complete
MAYKQKGFSPFTIITDKKKKKKKPVDDDTDRMSNRQFRRHEREVEKYNKARGNYAKMRDNSRLMDKLKDQEIELGRELSKFNQMTRDGIALNEAGKARLKELKREIASNKRLLKNIRKAK